jgi:hypothetical protein
LFVSAYLLFLFSPGLYGLLRRPGAASPSPGTAPGTAASL